MRVTAKPFLKRSKTATDAEDATPTKSYRKPEKQEAKIRTNAVAQDLPRIPLAKLEDAVGSSLMKSKVDFGNIWATAGQ